MCMLLIFEVAWIGLMHHLHDIRSFVLNVYCMNIKLIVLVLEYSLNARFALTVLFFWSSKNSLNLRIQVLWVLALDVGFWVFSTWKLCRYGLLPMPTSSFNPFLSYLQLILFSVFYCMLVPKNFITSVLAHKNSSFTGKTRERIQSEFNYHCTKCCI